jgi:hypothetical protein
MYQRKRKDNFCEKIEKMIVGRNKRTRNKIINDGTNINDGNNINDGININISDNNDNGHNNDLNRDIGRINNIPDKNRVKFTRWIPSNKKIKGIRKFGDKQDKQFKTKKINL